MYKGCLFGGVWAYHDRLGHAKAETFRSNRNFHNLILGALAVDATDPENRCG